MNPYQVSPLTWYEVALSFAIALFLIYLCIKIDRSLKREQVILQQAAKRRKRQAHRKATIVEPVEM